MKYTLRHILFLSLIISLLFTACVSNKKFAASEANVEKLQKENDKVLSQLNESNAKVKKLTLEKSSLQDENAEVFNTLKDLSRKSKTTIADQANRLKSLHNIMDLQRNLMDNLKKSISNALVNYKNDELSIYIKDGNVYISLAEKLLFKSGSDDIDPKGKEALKTLAGVLNVNENIHVMIEGHTDNVPIKTKQFVDNWDLSTSRATNIVRILTQDFGFDSRRIIASGRGEFFPVQINDTAERRAANRRIEVIVSPDLSEIFNVLYH